MKRAVEGTTFLDWVLLVVLLLLSLGGFVLVKRVMPPGETVVIEVDGKGGYRLPLGEDRVVGVKGPLGITKVVIRDGRVRVEDSPCPQKICVKEGWIRQGAIVCLPNRVVVSVTGGKKGPGGVVDAITR